MKTTIRTLALLLAVLTLTLCFAACDGKGSASFESFKTADGVVLTIGAKADGTIEMLGKWIDKNSSASCGGFSGNDYDYTYRGFRVFTTPAKDGDVICKIELTDDSVKTPEGLYIGMTRADVETAMKGFKAEAVGDNLVYKANGVKLQVTFRDGAVNGIIYVAA
jgi:hypothetical protein